MMQASQQLWDTLDDLHLLPSGEASRVKARWFRPDRALAGDPEQFGRWLVTNGYLTKHALEQIRQGKADTLRLGQYLLLEPCPKGPHEGSFLASDTLGRKVQVDLVAESLTTNPEVMRAFESAAERLMGVQSGHVHRVLDFGQAQGRLYLVREYEEGVTLAEVLARRRKLDAEQASRLFAQAFAGLHALHDKQVQGGELSADSLILAAVPGKGRAVKILHAGIPRAILRSDALGVNEIVPLLRPLTRPEDDLFRLGQTFYLALTGQRSEASLAGGTPVPPLTDVPELLAQVVENLLDANVVARPRVAGRVAKTLRVFLASAEHSHESRAEEEIAAPGDPPRTTAIPTAPEEVPEPAVRDVKTSKARELWEEVRPRDRELLFLVAGAGGILVIILLVMLISGIKLMYVVCLLTGAAVAFFAERLLRQRERQTEAVPEAE